MDAKTKEKLTMLYGADNEEGLQAFLDKFEQTVDGVNRTIKDENLVHRAKGAKTEEKPKGKDAPAPTSAPTADEDEDEDEDTEENESDSGDNEIVIDDETVAEIATQVAQSKEFKALAQGILDLKSMVGELVVERDNDKKEISRLNTEVQRLGKDDVEKKTEYLQDLPKSKRTHISHRPREVHSDESQPESMAAASQRMLANIPAASRY